MSQIQIRLGTVIGDEDLTVLIGIHGPGIDVEIGIEFAHPDRVTTGLQQGSQCSGRETLAQGGYHAASHEYVPRHGRLP